MKRIIAIIMLTLASIGFATAGTATAAVGVQHNCVVTNSAYTGQVKCYSVDTNPAYNGLMRVEVVCSGGVHAWGPWVFVGNASVKTCPLGHTRLDTWQNFL